MAEEKLLSDTSRESHPIRRLTDSQLRKESKRRRFLASGFSVIGSLISMIGAVAAQANFPASYSLVFIAALFGTNITLVLYLFRWMAVPAKEAARRRRNSVLEMLNATAQPEQ